MATPTTDHRHEICTGTTCTLMDAHCVECAAPMPDTTDIDAGDFRVFPDGDDPRTDAPTFGMTSTEALRAMGMRRVAILTMPEARRAAVALGLAEIPFTLRRVASTNGAGTRATTEYTIFVPGSDSATAGDLIARAASNRRTDVT